MSKISRFIVLIPHRDALGSIEEYRRRLFAAGFPGAYAFPVAAPLAMVSRPFSREELKALARSLPRGKDGKILGEGTALVRWPYAAGETTDEGAEPGLYSFFGIPLDFPVREELFPQTARDKIIHIPGNADSCPVLCTALVHSGMNSGEEQQIREEAPVLSFRTASLANLAIRPLGAGDLDYSFEWKIGPHIWLPKLKRDHCL